MAVCMTCWAIMENPLSCEDLSEDTLCAVDPKIDTKKIWKYKLKINKNFEDLHKKVYKKYLYLIHQFEVSRSLWLIPKKAAYLPAKRKTNSTGTFSLELNCFFFTLDSNQSVRNFTNIVYYVLFGENTTTTQ